MTIRFPPDRRQPPPHYGAGPRRVEVAVERAVVRAIVHPDAVRIWEPPPIASRPSITPVAPHAISFVAGRPPPGKAVAPKSTRAVVRAVVHADATRPSVPRPARERSGSSPTVPHSITFDASIKPPR